VSIRAERAITAVLDDAVAARRGTVQARERERVAVATFIHEALRQHWTWAKIGEKLDISDTAAKTFYQRNRTKVRSA
jgi:hypothetical protein